MTYSLNPSTRLGILDNYFPDIHTGFRVAEFNWYLEHFQTTSVFSYCKDFATRLSTYHSHYPQYSSRIQQLTPVLSELPDIDLFYCVFLPIAYGCITYPEKFKKPLVFTLYPGGGFQMDDSISDDKLKRVFASPAFKKVIATQKTTYDYLISKHQLVPEQIELIYGVVTHNLSTPLPKQFYLQDKVSFDLCFVASRYTPQGIDKGYDIFIEVCKKLHQTSLPFRFHVVGGFNATHIDVSELGESIVFYGHQTADFFPAFYAQMDIILSPTRPFCILPGAFDGFPTTCCVDAALSGTLVMSSDPLGNNLYFTPNEDIIIIDENVDAITSQILFLEQHPDQLYAISQKGQHIFSSLFSLESQMSKRIETFKKVLS